MASAKLPPLQGLRLPSIPANMVSSAPAAPPPPPPPVPAVFGQSAELEFGTYTFESQPGAWVQHDGPTKVYTTKRRWRGCDVYVDTQAGTSGGFVRIWVYAISGGSRVLVETGWLAVISGIPEKSRSSRRVVAARAVAERFEIEAEIPNFSAAFPLRVFINVVASDECLEPVSDGVGIAPATAGRFANDAIITPFTVSANPARRKFYDTQLEGALVTNTTAGVLYWQAVDAVDVPSAAGVAPIFSVAIPGNQTVSIPAALLRGYRFGVNGCVCGGSSTPAIFTAIPVGQILHNVWCR